MPASDKCLNVTLASCGLGHESGSPVSALDSRDEGENGAEPESAESHPYAVKVPSEHPCGGDQS